MSTQTMVTRSERRSVMIVGSPSTTIKESIAAMAAPSVVTDRATHLDAKRWRSGPSCPDPTGPRAGRLVPGTAARRASPPPVSGRLPVLARPGIATRGRLGAQRCEDRLGGTLVPQAPRVENEGVVPRIAPVRRVLLACVRGPGRVGPGQAAACIL